jgi:hypothetical protein
VKRLLLMVGITVVALAIHFGGAVFRETQVEGRPLRTAMGTGLVVVGFLAPIFVVAIIAQWREDHRDPSEAESLRSRP